MVGAEDPVHKPLEGCGSSVEAKRHNLKLEVPKRGRRKFAFGRMRRRESANNLLLV